MKTFFDQKDSKDDIAPRTRNIKKIIIVLTSFELGGSEWQALQFALFLKNECQADVRIWGLNTMGRTAQICDQHGLPWKIIQFYLGNNPIVLLKDLFCFTAKLIKEDPDVVMSYTQVPNVICGLSWRFSGAKVFLWNQRDEGLGLDHPRFHHRLATYLTQYFISNSHHAKNFLVHTFSIKPDQVFVIPNGIDVRRYVKAERRTNRLRLNIREECFVVCMVANLHKNKDHVTLLKAWRIVVDKLFSYNKCCVLLLAGRFDNTYPSLKGLLSELELTENVIFLGNVNNVFELLSAVDVSVHSSVHEGCPNGVLESMAAGLPVAATDIPGIREAIGPAYPYLAPPHDADRLAEIILGFALDDDLRIRVGMANRLHVQKEFNLDTMCHMTLFLIEEAIKNRGKALWK